MQTTQTVSFSLNLVLNTSHPEEACNENYMGRAFVTSERLTDDEGGQLYQSAEIEDLWLGIDVPAEWNESHFRKVSIPYGSKLMGKLEEAAISALDYSELVTLPDEIKI